MDTVHIDVLLFVALGFWIRTYVFLIPISSQGTLLPAKAQKCQYVANIKVLPASQMSANLFERIYKRVLWQAKGQHVIVSGLERSNGSMSKVV